MTDMNSSSKHYLVIADSHGKHLPSHIKTKSHDIVIKAISGLKWCDYYNKELSLNHLLSSSNFDSLLSHANAVLFLIGTNSVRIFSYFHICNQIKHIIKYLREKYSQLNNRHNIIVNFTFPCFKTSKKFPTSKSLLRNINSFNKNLTELSIQMNFKTINFYIENHHISYDNIHIYRQFQYLIFDGIKYQFDKYSKKYPETN